MEEHITRTDYFLVIILLVIVWYGIVPVMGALFNRYKWRRFRKRYNELRVAPVLDYRQYRNLENDGKTFRFTGGIESLTDGKILWVKGEDPASKSTCTIPVSLEKTQCWLLPMNEGENIPNPPEQINWNKVSTLTEGVKVFVGGQLKSEDSRLNYVTSKENPLIVIFYNCRENELTEELILASRTRNEYWNALTPVSLLIGAFSLIYIAVSLLNRPAFRFHVIASLVAMFVPVLPIIPPGLLFTAAYNRLTLYTRKLRAYRDLARINNPASFTKSPSIKAYTLEVTAWLLLITGVVANMFFIFLILSLLE